MTTMIAEVYDALVEAGASEQKARAAAEAVAGYDDRFNRIETRLGRMEGEMHLLKWQVGATWAVMLAVGAPSVWLMLRIAAKVGALG